MISFSFLFKIRFSARPFFYFQKFEEVPRAKTPAMTRQLFGEKPGRAGHSCLGRRGELLGGDGEDRPGVARGDGGRGPGAVAWGDGGDLGSCLGRRQGSYLGRRSGRTWEVEWGRRSWSTLTILLIEPLRKQRFREKRGAVWKKKVAAGPSM